MKKIFTLSAALCMLALPAAADEQIVLLNEGNWGSDNGTMSYFANGTMVSNDWFKDVNKTKLGDTPTDIVRADDNTLAITVNQSNIIQFIDLNCKAVGSIEGVPNCRKMVSDGSYLYVTSYAHECTVAGATVNFTKGYVAKVDLATKKVVSAVEVGYEPEGIVIYGGRLFVANTGGYSYMESHDYESTVSVVNAATMTVERTIDVKQVNLSGQVSRSGRYMLVSSPGDYYTVSASTVVLDCQAVIENKADAECYQSLTCKANYNTVGTDGNFLCVGSEYSYSTASYVFDFVTINPALVMSSNGQQGVEKSLPGTIATDVAGMSAPNDFYVNPETGYIYATDSGDYVSAGWLYQWTPEGKFVDKYRAYISPGHILSLAQGIGGVDNITTDATDANAQPVGYYNMQGVYSATPWDGLNIVRMSDGTARKVVY